MARVGFTGNGALFYVPTIADTAAPTAAEMTAGTNLTPWLVRDSLTRPSEAATLDASDAASRQNKVAPGNYGGGEVTASFLRDTVAANDDAWDTLVKDTEGFLVVRDFGGADTAAAAGDVVEVYPGSVNSRAMGSGDQTARFEARWAVNGEVEQDAVVAA